MACLLFLMLTLFSKPYILYVFTACTIIFCLLYETLLLYIVLLFVKIEINVIRKNPSEKILNFVFILNKFVQKQI